MKKIHKSLLLSFSLGITLSHTYALATISLQEIPLTIASSSSSCVTLTSSLVVGHKDTTTKGQVTVLQQFLKEKGFLADSPTGYYGSRTKNAVAAFQRSLGIETTGSVGPKTRITINKDLSCLKTIVSAPILSSSTKSNILSLSQEKLQEKKAVPEVSSAAYQAFVGGALAIDASSVPKEYATDSCQKLITKNPYTTVTCMWGGVVIASSTAGVEPAYIPQPVITDPSAPYIPSVTTNNNPQLSTQTSNGAPSVLLLISPISVPYQGGYDSFELRTTGMNTCTLYFKDEPSTMWISGGSSLGTNFTLPGFKGMTKSRSYYVSCKDSSGRGVDSSVVTITVGS